jgi:hypothetical protein
MRAAHRQFQLSWARQNMDAVHPEVCHDFAVTTPLHVQSHTVRMSPDFNCRMLPPIEGLEFDEAAHRYKYKGRWLSNSPTGVLSIGMDEYAKRRIEETRHEWEPRGNKCHQWLEHHLTGAAELDVGEYGEWISPLKGCWLWEDCEVLASELRLVDPKRNMGGSVDFIIKTAKGTIAIGDLKTVKSKEAADKRKPAEAQLGSYIRMVNLNYPDISIEKAVTVVAAPGYCKVITSEVQACDMAWDDAWQRYKLHQELLGF